MDIAMRRVMNVPCEECGAKRGEYCTVFVAHKSRINHAVDAFAAHLLGACVLPFHECDLGCVKARP